MFEKKEILKMKKTNILKMSILFNALGLFMYFYYIIVESSLHLITSGKSNCGFQLQMILLMRIKLLSD